MVAMLGLFILCKSKDQSKMRVITVALFCLFFSLGVELLWEIFERILDVFFNQTAQGPKVDGTINLGMKYIINEFNKTTDIFIGKNKSKINEEKIEEINPIDSKNTDKKIDD